METERARGTRIALILFPALVFFQIQIQNGQSRQS